MTLKQWIFARKVGEKLKKTFDQETDAGGFNISANSLPNLMWANSSMYEQVFCSVSSKRIPCTCSCKYFGLICVDRGSFACWPGFKENHQSLQSKSLSIRRYAMSQSVIERAPRRLPPTSNLYPSAHNVPNEIYPAASSYENRNHAMYRGRRIKQSKSTRPLNYPQKIRAHPPSKCLGYTFKDWTDYCFRGEY